MTETDDTTDERTDTTATAEGSDPADAPPDDQVPSEPRDADGSGSAQRVTLRRVLNVLGVLLLLAVVAPFVVYAVPGVVGADASFVVLSGSMEPAISAGDVVVVESVPPGAIAVDDVVTYSRSDEGATVTHRVIEVDDTGDERVFYTKGDANEDADQRPVPASALVGSVVLTIPYIGYVIQFVGTRTGFALLVVLPFGALLVTEVGSYLRRRRHGDGQATERESPAPVRTTAERDASTEAVAISSTDMLLTLGVLAAVLPYLGFVALQRESALSIGIAVGFGTAFALLAGVFISARLRERSQASGTRDSAVPDRPTAASDGGTTPEEER
ncbi:MULTISPECIES: signal peptidase I [Halolamina]|uniref:Signal peptidase, endoplasmic reticulum-type n=1 Tax=Halolamina pelagica TaxID=699431 RepID=A0A1I5Q9R5_9EURY|nr:MULTISPECIES: signal peptidase I [Halolamina]NHX35167.1 signal peptidase I [Halolamina sp. R1-12]SFP43019.1 signal peptidase, endoplasmic reticulum-type [Halolamina pelagica]